MNRSRLGDGTGREGRGLWIDEEHRALPARTERFVTSRTTAPERKTVQYDDDWDPKRHPIVAVGRSNEETSLEVEMNRVHCRPRSLSQADRAVQGCAKGTTHVHRALPVNQAMYTTFRSEVVHLTPMLVVTHVVACSPAAALPGLTKMEEMELRKEERKKRLHEAVKETRAESPGQGKSRSSGSSVPPKETKRVEEGVFSNPSYTLPEDNVHRRHGQNEMFQG